MPDSLIEGSSLIDPSIFAILAISLYLMSAAILFRAIRAKGEPVNGGSTLIMAGITAAWVAAICNALALVDVFLWADGFNFSFFSTASLVTLIVVLLLLTAAIRKPVEKLGIVIFPLAAVLLLVKIYFPAPDHVLRNLSPGMELHILVSILSFGLLNIAAVQAILLALQDWQLHNRYPNRFARSLPPLQTMESLLFQMIAVGFLLLTVSLLSGLVFVNDLLAQHLAHKTVLSILAWMVFGVLLYGRFRHGWRGKTAIRWTLSGFVFLTLAYFGSKMVLELILKRG